MDALSIVAKLAGGTLLDELAEALERVSEEVVESGKAGAVSLTLAVKPVGERGDPRVIVEESISRKPPKRPVRGAIFYAVAGGLHQMDPRQIQMDFRPVETGAEVRETGAEPATVREA